MEEPSKPLYPFGYGLSYTTFDYANLVVKTPGSGKHEGSPYVFKEMKDLTVAVDVTNTGARDGEEVVQLYLIDEIASTVRPRKQLCGFARVAIPAGETRTVEIQVNRRSFEMVNVAGETVIEPGTFRLQAGASAADIRCETIIQYEP